MSWRGSSRWSSIRSWSFRSRHSRSRAAAAPALGVAAAAAAEFSHHARADSSTVYGTAGAVAAIGLLGGGAYYFMAAASSRKPKSVKGAAAVAGEEEGGGGEEAFQAALSAQEPLLRASHMSTASKEGHSHAMIWCALVALRDGGAGKAAEAVALLERAAGLGNAQASLTLLQIFENGCVGSITDAAGLDTQAMGLRKDQVKANAYLKMAAEAGDVGCITRYAKRLADGSHGLEHDLELAGQHFLLAAEQGDAEGQYNAGLCLLVQGDAQRGMGWVKKAAEQRLPEAMNEYGKALMEGRGCQRNQDLAVLMFQTAAEAGRGSAHGEGAYLLGVCLVNGVGKLGEEDEGERKETARRAFKAALQFDSSPETKRKADSALNGLGEA